MNASVPALWRAYLSAIDETPEAADKTHDAWSFGDNPADVDERAVLVYERFEVVFATLLDQGVDPS